jgi:long-chain acyl-CoA synthetase
MSDATIEELEVSVAGETVPRRFIELMRRSPESVMLRARRAGTTDQWDTWTIAEVGRQAARVAAGLRELGVHPGERVLLMMRNRPDFHWLDLAVQSLGATPVSIYNSSSAEEIEYLAGDAGAEIAIVENAVFLDRLQAVRWRLPALAHVFVIDAPVTGLPGGVRLAADLEQSGELDLAELAAATDPADIATLIYTSGTTGPPKGVMISQFNVVYTVEQLRRCIGLDTYLGRRVVSYLPMAHIAERMMSHYQTLLLGYEVTCCPEASALPSYLAAVRPEITFGVPRVWEKIHNGVVAMLAHDPDMERRFGDGLALALEIKAAERRGEATTEQLETWAFLDAVAFRTVRALVGLDEVVVGVSGAAPIPRDVLEWFCAIGVPLSEIYGMSESSGPMTWSPDANRPGSVGRALPGSEVLIADDGEVLFRGGNVYQGYLNLPAKTAETVVDGWLHSGDIGELDADGYLRIVDRKKELIITSGGKNISPANLEAALKTIPLVGQAAAIGDARKFCTALLVLDPEVAGVWSAAHHRPDATLDELAAHPDVIAEVQRGVDQVNEQFAQVEQIKRFTLLGEEWMPDSDVLTPTSKLKRRGINARFADQIEAMYAGLD